MEEDLLALVLALSIIGLIFCIFFFYLPTFLICIFGLLFSVINITQE